MSSVPNYSTPLRSAPLGGRINLRMIVFIGVILALVGYPVYIYLDSVISGGVKNLGNGYKEVNLKAMSNFSFDQDNGTLEDIPQQWRELDGQKVVLYGEMFQPMTATDGRVGRFQLCYSIAKCCVGGLPLVQHFVDSRVPEDRALYSYPNLVKVSGVLHVRVVRDKEANKVSQIYQLDVENIEPA